MKPGIGMAALVAFAVGGGAMDIPEGRTGDLHIVPLSDDTPRDNSKRRSKSESKKSRAKNLAWKGKK